VESCSYFEHHARGFAHGMTYLFLLSGAFVSISSTLENTVGRDEIYLGVPRVPPVIVVLVVRSATPSVRRTIISIGEVILVRGAVRATSIASFVPLSAVTIKIRIIFATGSAMAFIVTIAFPFPFPLPFTARRSGGRPTFYGQEAFGHC
jgi:hypothetical protein